MMKKQHADRRVSALLVTIIVASMFLILSGTTFAATLLNSRQLPTEPTLKGSTGNEKFNTLRFETYGGQAESRLIGYFLYKDGIHVTGGPQLTSIGKQTLNEVFADNDRIIKERMYVKPGNLLISEIIRDNSVIGYAVSPMKMEITLWDISKDPSKISLELRFKDLQAKGDRYDGGPR